MGCKAERDPGVGLHHAPYLAQSNGGVRPDLKRVDRQCPVEAVFGEGEARDRAAPQLDLPTLNGLGVPLARLLDHLGRGIDAHDKSGGRQPRHLRNDDARPEAYLQHVMLGADLEQRRDPCAAIPVGVRHDAATQPAQRASRPTEHSERKSTSKTYGWRLRIGSLSVGLHGSELLPDASGAATIHDIADCRGTLVIAAALTGALRLLRRQLSRAL